MFELWIKIYLGFDKIFKETKFQIEGKLGFGGRTKVLEGQTAPLPNSILHPVFVANQ